MAMADGAIADAELAVIRRAAGLLGVEADLQRAQDWASAMLSIFRSGERFISRAA